MADDFTPLQYFGPTPSVGRRRSTPIGRWLIPLLLSVVWLALASWVCQPLCCRWYVRWLCPRQACNACGWLPFAWAGLVAALAWSAFVVLRNPTSIRPVPGGVIEIDPEEARDRIDIWYCPQELAVFVRERIVLQQRDPASIIRLKSAVTRWMDDRGVPIHLREVWMLGAMASALVMSPQEKELIRLTQQVNTPDSRLLSAWHKQRE